VREFYRKCRNYCIDTPRGLEKRAEVLRERKHPRLANRLLWQANDLWQEDEHRWIGSLSAAVFWARKTPTA